MNEYIINPAWFYWVDVVSNISGFLGVSGVLCLIVTGVGFTITFWQDDEEMARAAKFFKKVIPAFALAVILAILLPTKEAMYQMMIAKYVTAENLNVSVEAIKSAVDYIVEALKAVR